MAFHSFEELEVWKRACQLAVRVYELLRECREYGLRDQMQRASVSIASNIAEGCERGGKDFSRMLRIAQGSAAELRTQMYIAAKLNLLTSDSLNTLIQDVKTISKMLTALRRTIDNRQNKKTEN